MRVAAFWCGVCVLCAAVVAAGSQSPKPQTPTFKSGVDVVSLDVSVLDKDRQPIHGLTPADFQVRENSKDQTITVFKPVDISDEAATTDGPGSWTHEVVADVRRNDTIKDPRVFIIVMDDAMAVPDAWMLKQTKDIAFKVIDKLGPSDLAAVVFTSAGASAQDLTNDHVKLKAAADRFNAGNHTVAPVTGMEISEERNYLAPLRTLQSAAEALIGAPQSRKAMVFISSGVPVDFEAKMQLTMRSGGPGAASTAPMAMRELQNRLIEDMKEVFKQARLANINVYCLDSAGLDGLDAYIAREHARVDPLIYHPFNIPTYESAQNYRDFSLTLAENTGGLAVINTNDFTPGIAQMFKENGSYYLIGYQPTDSKRDGSYRRIEVKVNRPGSIVRSKSGYYAEKTLPPDKAAAAAMAKTATAHALASALPQSGIPLQIAVAPFATPDLKSSTLAVAIAVRDDPGAPLDDPIDFEIDVFTTQQKLQTSQAMRARPPGVGWSLRGISYEFLTSLPLPPGRYPIRIAARRLSDGKAGSVYTDVDVPDFAREPLSLSGIVFQAEPGPRNPAPERLARVMPVVDTTMREFTTSDRVVAFFKVYERLSAAGIPVQIQFQILDDSGKVVATSAQSIAADQMDTASSSVSFPLPLARLSPGPHLLTIEATADQAAAKRSIRFDISK